MVMAAAAYQPTQYNNPNQTGSGYPLAIDGDLQVFFRSGGMFACHQRATATMQVEVDPGFIFDPLAGTLTQVGNIFSGNLHGNTTVDTLSQGGTSGVANGMAIRSTVIADGVPANATIQSGAGTSSLTLSAVATTSTSGVILIASQLSTTIAAPSANPRIDRVVVDGTTGLISVVTGAENANPVPPAIPAGKLPVAQIALSVGVAFITGNMITDERAVWAARAPGIPWAVAAGTSDHITAAYAPANPALYDGLILAARALAANATNTPDFSPDGLPRATITQLGGQSLIGGSIAGPGHELLLRYAAAGPRWELLNPQPVPGVPTGSLIEYSGIFAPTGYYFADAANVTRAGDAALFAATCLSTTGNFSSGSPIVTNIPSTNGMKQGMPVSVNGVLAYGLTIASVDSTSQIHLSGNASGNLTAGALIVMPNGPGANDGGLTFTLADRRGRVGIGRDDMNSQGTSSNPANRVTSGGSGINGQLLGASGGAETVTLSSSTQASMSVTTGSVTSAGVSSGSVTVNSTTGQVLVETGTANLNTSGCGPNFAATPQGITSTGTVSGQTVSGQTVGAQTASGGGGAHQNMQPGQVCNVIVKR